MMRVYYDLHIHSCLSPCGDSDMTPANIVGMAALKGLQVVALTDHNSCRNCPAFMKEAEEAGILGIPGMELTTSEEVHALCLFPGLEQAMRFQEFVDGRRMRIPNREDIFGRQEIYDENDRMIGTEENLLILASELSFEGLFEQVDSFGGVMVPAHIDRPSNSLLSNLGFVPPDSRFAAAEVKDLQTLPELYRTNPCLRRCRILNSSDAHSLWQIHEPEQTLEIEEWSARAVIRALQSR